MKAPVAQKGSAGAPSTNKRRTVNGHIVQTGPTTYQVQGSARKPYEVDLQGTDARAKGKTAKCDCTNWVTVRNRMVGADPKNNFTGYSCKHIAECLKLAGTASIPQPPPAPKTPKVDEAKERAASEARAKKIRDKVLKDFLR